MDVKNIPTHKVEAALNHAQELAASVEQLVGRLIGFVPMPVADNYAGDAVDSGLLGQLDCRAQQTIGRIVSAKDELTRLLDVLPPEPPQQLGAGRGDVDAAYSLATTQRRAGF